MSDINETFKYTKGEDHEVARHILTALLHYEETVLKDFKYAVESRELNNALVEALSEGYFFEKVRSIRIDF